MNRREVIELEELLKDVGDDIHFWDEDKVIVMIATIEKLLKPYR